MIARKHRTLLTSLLLGAGLVLLGHSFFIEGKAVVAQVLLKRAWAETVETGTQQKPWRWADTWPVARIEFPVMGKSAIVLQSASGEAMAFGPGHVSGTPLPGEPGTSVIAAHRDTHFEGLQYLEIGDEVLVETESGHLRFEMTHSEVVRWDRSGILPMLGKPKLALITCYPFDAKIRGPMRYVVYLKRV